MHLIRRVLSLLTPVTGEAGRAPAASVAPTEPAPEQQQETAQPDLLAAFLPRGEVISLAEYRNGRQ